MIQIRKEILQFNINLKEIKSNVESSIKDCNYPSNKKNNVLLTFLFMSIQLFNNIAIKNNIEPITLKQLNELESHKGGGRRKRKKTKKKKKKLKKKKTRINSYYNSDNKNNYFSNYSKRRHHPKDMSTFANILSKIALGGTLLMIILASLGTVDAQVSSVGMPFDDFVEVIHNTVGIGNNSLSYIEQHDLTVNYGSLYNDTQTFVKGYCAPMSAVSAGLVMIDEFNQLLINKGSFERGIAANKKLKTSLSRSRSQDSITHTNKRKRFLKKLKEHVYHPGGMLGFPISQVSNTEVVTTIFQIPGIFQPSKEVKEQLNPDNDTQNMIDIVHETLEQSRNFAVEKGIINKTDVSFGMIWFPGHAMTVNVLPSGALVVRNADSLHKPTTGNWLTYKPPLNVNLSDKSSPKTQQVIDEWNKLNKKINPITRKIDRQIANGTMGLKPYGGNNRGILSSITKPLLFFFDTSILPSGPGNTPIDSLSQFFFKNFKLNKKRQIEVIGNVSPPNPNILTKNTQPLTANAINKQSNRHLSRLKDVECGDVARNELANCIINMNVGEILRYPLPTHEFTSGEKLNVLQLRHIPSKVITNSKQRKKQILKTIKDLKTQSKTVGKVKRLNEYSFKFN